jgi:hypothetical protein
MDDEIVLSEIGTKFLRKAKYGTESTVELGYNVMKGTEYLVSL